MPGSIHTVDQAASAITTVNATVNNHSALVSKITRCKRVWLGRPAGETVDLLVGVVGQTENRLLAAADTAGFYIHLDDAAKIRIHSPTLAAANVVAWIEH